MTTQSLRDDAMREPDSMTNANGRKEKHKMSLSQDLERLLSSERLNNLSHGHSLKKKPFPGRNRKRGKRFRIPATVA